ncbi:MAG: carboxypeptidase-like regulatory domain-containing protein [Thermoanaerobaculia bacterium]|nr:carboxypeptidase-like regulatory domain-containing protein [Thermoanaerobaculia bacterium]
MRIVATFVLAFGALLGPASASPPPLLLTAATLDETTRPLPEVRAELRGVVDLYRRGRIELGLEAEPPAVAEARSDAAGELRLEVPEPGVYELHLSAPGRVPIRIALTPLTAPTDLGLLMLPPAEELTVRVLGPAGQPVAGARVALVSEAPTPRQDRLDVRLAERRARTDARGQATLPRMPGEDVAVWVAGPDGMGVRKPASEGTPVVVSLPTGSRWTATLKDHEGKPAAGVIAWRQSTPLGISNAAGVLALSLPTAKQSESLLFVAPEGRRIEPPAPVRPGVVQLGVSTSPAAPHTLPPVLRLAGRVSTPDGKPLPKALVWDLYDPGHLTHTGPDGRWELVVRRGFGGRLGVAAGALGWSTAEVRHDSEHAGFDVVLSAPAALAGRVVDRSGSPVAQAEVACEPTAGALGVTTRFGRTAADGSFQLAAIFPATAGRVTARLPQRASAQVELAPVAPGATRSGVELTLELHRRAIGRVVDRDGKSVAGARVRLGSSTESDLRLVSFDAGIEALARQADSDQSGRFTVVDVAPGQYDLTVRASGKVEAAVRGLEISPGTGDVDLGTVRLDDTVELKGRVETAGGEAVAGAEIQTRRQRPGRLVSDRPGRDAEPLISGPNGQFVISDLESSGTYTLEVSATGYAPATVEALTVPRAEPVVVTLTPGARVRGSVRNEEGQPVADAEVAIESSERGISAMLLRRERPPSARTDAEGAFDLEDLKAGSLTLKARAQGYAESDPKGLELTAGQVVTDVVIVLPPGATVAGRVLGPDGEPRAAAAISLRSSGLAFGSPSGPRAQSDRDGRFELVGVPLGDQTFLAEAEDLLPATRSVTVQAGRNSLDFELEAGLEISGRVLGPQGEALGTGELEVSRQQPGLSRTEFRPLEADGSFHLRGLVAGDYEVRVLTELGVATAQVTVGPASVVGLVLQVVRGVTVRGRITGLDFDTLGKTQVLAFLGTGGFLQGKVDFKGHYRIESLTPGSWNLMVSAEGRRQTKVVDISAELTEVVLDIAFEDGLTLSVQVQRGGKPVPGLRMFASGAKAGGSQATTDAEGWARATGLEAGRVSLTFLDPTGGFTHREEVELEESREHIIDLGSRTVEGRVTTSDGDPLPGAAVRLEAVGEGPSGTVLPGMEAFSTHTTDAGGFRLTAVPARRFRVVATKSGYAQAEAPCDLTEASAEGLELQLAASRGLTLLLQFGADPVPPEWYVAVSAVGPGGDTAYRHVAQPDDRGRLRLETLPTGSWTLLVSHTSTLIARVPVVSPGPSVTVRLEPGASLEVQVPSRKEERSVKVTLLDASGQPVEGLAAAWSGELTKTWPLQWGSTEIFGLPGGRYTVRVETAEGEVLSGTAEVAPGSRAVVVIP